MTAVARARRPAWLEPRTVLIVSVALLLVIGIVMVYSASAVADYVKFEDSAYHARKQVQFAVLGVLGMLLASRWDPRERAKRASRPAWLHPGVVAWGIWGAALVLLLGVEVAGVETFGATRSLAVGPVYVQPSEFAKLGCLLVTALLITQRLRGDLTPVQFTLRLGGALGAVVFLVMRQPDFGTTVSITMAASVVLLLAGVRKRWFVGIAAIGIPAAAFAIWKAGYRMERITAFLNPWADPTDTGYQIIQSLYALGSGGLFGVGLGTSRQKFFYLPAAHNDFIFSIIGEETGLVGALVVIALFVAFAWAGFRIAAACKDPFARIVAGGLTAMIVIQALMNMAAATQLMPITGIPLPFVSAGGSSLTLTLVSVGIILSVARHGGGARVRLVRESAARGSERAGIDERRRDGGTRLPGTHGGRASGRRGA